MNEPTLTLEVFQGAMRNLRESLDRAIEQATVYRSYQLERVEIRYRQDDREERIDIPISSIRPISFDLGRSSESIAQRIDWPPPAWSFTSVVYDQVSPARWGSCPCPMCEADRARGITVRGGEPQITPVDDQTAYTSLRALLSDTTPYEVAQARDALRRGKMHGLSSTHCLIAIIAHARGETYMSYSCARFGVTAPPIERWVMDHIAIGMTPQNDAHAALLDSWLSEWIDSHTLEVRPAQPPASIPDALGTLVLESWPELALRE